MENRISKAHAIARYGLVGVLARDKERRPTVLIVPGSRGRQYRVIVRRGASYFDVDCWGIDGYRCHGIQKTVCYHALAALSHIAREHDNSISFAKYIGDANATSNLVHAAQIVRVYPHGSSTPMFALIVNDSDTARADSEARKQSDIKALYGE